jgi:hypothetical protein
MENTPEGVVPMQNLQPQDQPVTTKREWPELVGTDATEAKEKLEQETKKSCYLVPKGSMVTMDYSESRIRIFYDQASNKVTQPPRVG